MIVLTTLFNAEKYIEQCISSIMAQSYRDFKCYITDDLSTDNSVSLVKELIKDDDRFILVENKNKMYQPGNYDQIIRNNPDISDDEICLEVDGDDWLPNANVFSQIDEIYKNEKVWITNGSFRYSNGQMGFSSRQKITENLRHDVMTCSHLRTWRAFLWRAIKEEDLKDENGQYWKVTGDLAFMFPMLEMAGDEHYFFINYVTYIYNEQNPLNDHKVNMPMVSDIANKIRQMPKYDKL